MNENIKVIKENDFNTRFPNTNENTFNKLDNESKDLYLQLYSTYSCMFRKYIIKKLDLLKYDKLVENSELNYVAIKDENMDIYQDFTKDYLKYFYIRNNLYIERLTREEKEYVFQNFVLDNIELDEKMTEFIEKTYPKIIFEKTNNQTISKINFGPNNEQYYALNNSVVIGLRYDEFNLNGLSDDEWDKLHNKQLDNLMNILDDFVNNESSKLNTPLSIIVYNDFSIKKKLANLDKRK